jgi:hypothetical protein
VDGFEVQEERIIERFVYQGLPSSSFLTLKRYIRMEGNAVMYKCGGTFCQSDPVWDTLYYLGVPGDRWSSQIADPECYPHGVIEITDTGHVVIQGVSLRTWDLTYLDENGQPVPDAPSTFADSLGIIERIGCPVGNPPQPCGNGAVDYPAMLLLHYSDNEISIPNGSTCEIFTGTPALTYVQDKISLYPNPGSDILLINSSSTMVGIEVGDQMGRTLPIAQQSLHLRYIPTETWSRGTYFIRITLSDGTQIVQRWIKV